MAIVRQQSAPLSSVPLQILLYYNYYFFSLFFVVEILAMIWKGTVLPYASSTLASEVALLFLYALCEAIRLYTGNKGNLTETAFPLIVFLLLTLPMIMAYVFTMLFQTYVLHLDAILAYIGIGFCGLEFILGIAALVQFSRSDLSP